MPVLVDVQLLADLKAEILRPFLLYSTDIGARIRVGVMRSLNQIARFAQGQRDDLGLDLEGESERLFIEWVHHMVDREGVIGQLAQAQYLPSYVLGGP